MKRKTCSLVRIELVRGDVVIFFPIHNATTSDRWTWPLLNQSMAIANCKCNASDTSLLTNQFLPSHFGFTTNFFILIIIPSVPHRITKSTKLPRDLFLFILQPKQGLWFFSILFFFLFFFLNKRCLWFKCYTGPPQNQFESRKPSQHQTVKVKLHYCGSAFVAFF